MPHNAARSNVYCRKRKKEVKCEKREKGQPLPQFVLSPTVSTNTKTQEYSTKDMIRQYTIFCKLFLLKKRSQELYAEHSANLAEGQIVCPSCGSRGNCTGHGKYERGFIDYEEGKAVYRRLEVKRVRCGSCGHTHAVLPDWMIPYSTYSLLFILRVLAAYYLGSRTVEEICRRYAVSVSMLYEWKALFLKHKELWLGALESKETPPVRFIRQLLGLPSYSEDFSGPFYGKTAFSFLQRHKDAAHFRHAVF